MIEHPPGLQVLRFCAVKTPLSQNALLMFAAGRGLPSGVADPPERVVAIVKDPAGTETEHAGGEITEDTPGVYHATVEMLEQGEWRWEGQGWTSGQLVCNTGIIPWVIAAAIKV